MVAQKSRVAALACSGIFGALSISSQYTDVSPPFGHFLCATFAVHTWLQNNFLYYKHDLVKFEKIQLMSKTKLLHLFHILNLVLIIVDICLLTCPNSNRRFVFNFVPGLHITVSIISMINCVLLAILLLKQYKLLISSHTNRRYAQHLTGIYKRNLFWVVGYVIANIVGWSFYLNCGTMPVHILSICLTLSSLFLLLTYGDRHIIICPLVYTAYKNTLPQDRESIINVKKQKMKVMPDVNGTTVSRLSCVKDIPNFEEISLDSQDLSAVVEEFGEVVPEIEIVQNDKIAT